MGMALKKKVHIVVMRDDARILRLDDVTTASLAKARRRAIALMKFRNCPLSIINSRSTDDPNLFTVYEIIYGTPMGKLYWCNCRTGDEAYSIDVSGIPGATVLVNNIWPKMIEDIAWASNLQGSMNELRSRNWNVLGT